MINEDKASMEKQPSYGYNAAAEVHWSLYRSSII